MFDKKQISYTILNKPSPTLHYDVRKSIVRVLIGSILAILFPLWITRMRCGDQIY